MMPDVRDWFCTYCGYHNLSDQEACGQHEEYGCGAPRAEQDEEARATARPPWAHGTPETNPHYPYEGPAMSWVHA